MENALWDAQLIKEWTRKAQKQKEETVCGYCVRAMPRFGTSPALFNYVENPEARFKRGPLEETFFTLLG